MSDDDSYVHDLTDGKTLDRRKQALIEDDEDIFPQGITKVQTTVEPSKEDVLVALGGPEAPKKLVPDQKKFAGIPMAPVRKSSTPNINILIYGRPGCGKTHLAATADKSKQMGPCLYISAEAGSSTIRKVAPDMMVIPDPEVRGSVTWEEFETIYDELDRQCYNSDDGCDFRTVVIDTGTELQKLNMEWVMRQTLADHPDRDADVPGLHDWGKSTNRMRTMIRRFRDLPLNLIFICHEQIERDNKGIQWIRPDLPGKLGNQVAAFFDQAMYLYTKQQGQGNETEASSIMRVLMTGALEGYVTKDRSGNLPLLVVEPDMSKLYAMITKE